MAFNLEGFFPINILKLDIATKKRRAERRTNRDDRVVSKSSMLTHKRAGRSKCDKRLFIFCITTHLQKDGNININQTTLKYF